MNQLRELVTSLKMAASKRKEIYKEKNIEQTLSILTTIAITIEKNINKKQHTNRLNAQSTVKFQQI